MNSYKPNLPIRACAMLCVLLCANLFFTSCGSPPSPSQPPPVSASDGANPIDAYFGALSPKEGAAAAGETLALQECAAWEAELQYTYTRIEQLFPEKEEGLRKEVSYARTAFLSFARLESEWEAVLLKGMAQSTGSGLLPVAEPENVYSLRTELLRGQTLWLHEKLASNADENSRIQIPYRFNPEEADAALEGFTQPGGTERNTETPGSITLPNPADEFLNNTQWTLDTEEASLAFANAEMQAWSKELEFAYSDIAPRMPEQGIAETIKLAARAYHSFVSAEAAWTAYFNSSGTASSAALCKEASALYRAQALRLHKLLGGQLPDYAFRQEEFAGLLAERNIIYDPETKTGKSSPKNRK